MTKVIITRKWIFDVEEWSEFEPWLKENPSSTDLAEYFIEASLDPYHEHDKETVVIES